MRFRSLLLFSLLIWAATPATANGITFSSGSWTEMLSLAKEQQQLIFVEAYTDWCNICKSLERNTFRDEEVGAYFNANFINYRFDMEKGEGPAFSERYSVEGYPTLLFINYRGEVVYRVEGYMAPPRLMAAAREALRPEKNQSLLELQYEAGSSDPKVLYHYALNLKEAQRNYREAAARYFATQDERDLDEEQNWQAIEAFTTDLDSREFQYLMRKERRFMRRYGVQPVADKIYTVLKQNTIKAALTRNRDLYSQVLDLARDEVSNGARTASRLRLVYAEAAKEWADYAFKAVEHFERYTVIQATELDHAARNFYDHVDNPDLLPHALDWSRQAIAIDNDVYAYHETYALLLAKTGDLEAAQTQAFKTWQMGRLQDEIDTRAIEELLAKLGSPVK